jgi:hypothetical protein
MTCRIYGGLLAALSVLALEVGATEAFAEPGAARGAVVSTRSISHPSAFRRSFAHSFRHHRRNFDNGFFWPGVGDFSDFQPYSAPLLDGTQPASVPDNRYTYTYDVPWDWAHRFPPSVTPSDRPYVPSCSTETVNVPARGGSEQSVNITRCY